VSEFDWSNWEELLVGRIDRPADTSQRATPVRGDPRLPSTIAAAADMRGGGSPTLSESANRLEIVMAPKAPDL
jgi:hypothetical protein